MLRKRLAGGLIAGLPVLGAILLGGWVYIAAAFVVFGAATVEYAQLLARRAHRLPVPVLLVGVGIFCAERALPGFTLRDTGTAVLLLAAVGLAVLSFHRGTEHAFVDFALTVTGIVYIGWAGAHFIGLRLLPEGLYWTLTVVLVSVATDTAAFLGGRAVGKTPMMPSLSPGKTWEGYLAGVGGALLSGAGLALLWPALGAVEAASPVHILLIALLIAVVSPLGDFAISTLKRYVQVKDSGGLIPGHGGLLDRLDTPLIASLLGYYYLTTFAY